MLTVIVCDEPLKMLKCWFDHSVQFDSHFCFTCKSISSFLLQKEGVTQAPTDDKLGFVSFLNQIIQKQRQNMMPFGPMDTMYLFALDLTIKYKLKKKPKGVGLFHMAKMDFG